MTAAEKERVLELGGLYVLGTERHEARRIDNQLRGRSGRQGDPGESRFFVSLEDDLMIRFGGERVKGLMDRLNVDPDLPIESGMVSKQIEGAQVKVEGFNFDTRKHLLEYDEVINQQRTVIYNQRNEVLRREDLRPVIWDLLEAEIGGLVSTFTASEEPEEWDIESLATQVRTIFELPEDEDPTDWAEWEPDEIREHLLTIADELYAAKVERLGEEVMLQLERAVLLRAIDQSWIRHLTALDELRAGIGLRALAQEKPITVFKREGFDMFQSLLAVIGENAVRGVFLAEPAEQEQQQRRPRAMDKAVAGRGDLLRQAQKAGAERKPQTVRVGPKLSRNAPCWCGSGKKYKQCHMREDAEAGGPPAPASVQRD
jgi:preprotein translocase subunit SecA